MKLPRTVRGLGVATTFAALLTAAVITGSSTASKLMGSAAPRIEHVTRHARRRVAGSTPVDPARFAAGACVALPPTVGDTHHTVFLDAGHGGLDPGSVGVTPSGKRIFEAHETLAVELDAAALLQAQGFRVVVSRTRSGSGAVARLTPADIDGKLLTAAGVHDDVAARAVCANDASAQALVGIYFDAGSASNAGSVTGYDADRSFAAQNRRLATLIQRDTLTAMNAEGWQIPSGGVQLDSGLGSAVATAASAYGHLLELGPAQTGYFATPSRMPGAVIEPLFITDRYEAAIADSVHGQHVIASGVARAVEQYFRSAGGRRDGGRGSVPASTSG